MEALGCSSFGVVSDCFFWWYGVIRNRPPPYPSVYVSFRGANLPFVKSVRLEVPTVLSPLCQGVRFEDLGLNVMLVWSVTQLGRLVVDVLAGLEQIPDSNKANVCT